MRWFVSGDKHGDIQPILDFIKRFNLGADSAIIILGDLGLAWRKDLKDYSATIKKYEENCKEDKMFFYNGINYDLINPFLNINNNHNTIDFLLENWKEEIEKNKQLKEDIEILLDIYISNRKMTKKEIENFSNRYSSLIEKSNAKKLLDKKSSK